jgi:hypothetical protein
MWCPISNYDDAIVRGYIINIFLRLRIAVRKRYNTIETTEVARIGHIGLIFRLSIQVKDEVRKKKCGMSNTGSFLCFNSNISKLYNNSIIAKTNGMTFTPTTTLKWVYLFIYRQSPVPFIQCQVLKITKNICGRFFLVY